MEHLKASLSREEKLRFESHFAHMRQTGVKTVGKYTVMVTSPAIDEHLRFGVVCGRKFHKRAVRRNRARRLIWESVRKLRQDIQKTDVWLLFIPRVAILERKQPEVQSEIARLLSRNGLLENPGITGSVPRGDSSSSSVSTEK